MSDIIHLLPDHIANQIAAGEVIQRPSSVVKELMENSIDAKATHIEVNIKDAGRTLVQVIDNGTGMSETDARMAFERHATSKISKVDDLFSLHTMGFRGEALASIAAVAQVELRTRTKGNDVGIRLNISGSNLDSVECNACNEGTIFSVKNLFYNVPARRKFLKSNNTEYRHILNEFERVVLVHPEVSFILRHNDTTVKELPACVLRQRIIDVCGKSFSQKLVPLSTTTSIVGISGYVGSLESVRKHGCLQYFFVNGRYMRHPYFHKAVLQAYDEMVPTGEMPDYFIYFDLDPSTIDVNIHPTKTEIKFENEHPIWQILFSSVREAIAKAKSITFIDFGEGEPLDIPLYNANTKVQQPRTTTDSNYNPFHTSSRHISDDWKTLYESFNADVPSATGHDTIQNKLDGFTPKESQENLFQDSANVFFQYKNKYIIISQKSGLVCIDQYRAHICILYEQYIKNLQNQRVVSQKLLFPENIDFTPSEAAMLSEMEDEMRYLGFDIAPMSGNSFAIHGVPSNASSDAERLVKDVLAMAMEAGTDVKEGRLERMALSLAKSLAIRPGKPLTTEEMETLVSSLFALEKNGITPDGHATLTTITDEELERRLK